MTIEIKITADSNSVVSVQEQVADAMSALGFVRIAAPSESAQKPAEDDDAAAWQVVTSYQAMEARVDEALRASRFKAKAERDDTLEPETGPATRGVMNVGLDHAEAERVVTCYEGMEVRGSGSKTAPDWAAIYKDREPGQAGPGRKRRTSEQVAEDEAYAAWQLKQAELQPAPALTEEDAAQDEPAEPVAGPVEDEAVIAQDAADEAAEAAQNAIESAAPTLNDLRLLVGQWVKMVGFAKVQERLNAVVGGPIHAVKDEDLPVAMARVRAEIGVGPALAANAPDEPPQAAAPVAPMTRDDARAALEAYRQKFDPANKPSEKANVDAAAIIMQMFGAGVTAATIPDTPDSWAKLVSAIREAIEIDPFNRGGGK